MKRLFALLSLSLALVTLSPLSSLAGDLDAFQGLKGSLDIAGGTAHIPVMKDAARNIMEANSDIRISVAGGGSGVGVQKVGEGLVQIGNTGRALKEGEIEKYGLVSWPFAIDGVAVVVNPENAVSELDKKQLTRIFSGEVSNWKDVGGADAAISLYVREDGSGTRETFENKALEKKAGIGKSNVINSNGAMKTAVSQDKNAIGYVGIGHLDESVKGLRFDGTVPSQENAQSGAYKLTRLLYMNTKGQPEGLARAFIDYIYTPSGEAIITKSRYIPTGRP
ncbi:phosphate ABC transporter substrate-binding protein [Desulfovibrio sp. OttesenSCG-928-G15]|nr:phosphate ABC transporter substrate-binding protein [Desulfovibrio sp. OttesenSCG-928-G15]